jgi:hypothetical protein
MDFFSWKCAECNELISNKHSTQIEDSDCQLVTPNKTYRELAYDGYGEFNGVNVFSLLGSGSRDIGIDIYYQGDFMEVENLPFKIKIVHTRCAGKTYNELNESQHCGNQKFWYEEEE